MAENGHVLSCPRPSDEAIKVEVRNAQPEDEDQLRTLFENGMHDAHVDAPDFLKQAVSRYIPMAVDFSNITNNYVQKSRSAYLVAVIEREVVGGVGLHPVEAFH